LVSATLYVLHVVLAAVGATNGGGGGGGGGGGLGRFGLLFHLEGFRL